MAPKAGVTLAPVLVLVLAAAFPSNAAADVQAERGGRTIVRHDDADLRAILNWQDADEWFRKERWLHLELVLAPKKGPVSLRRAEVELLLPGGERVPLATVERYLATKSPFPRRPRTRSGMEMRNPLEGAYFQPKGMDGFPTVAPWLYGSGPGGTFPDEVEATPWKPYREPLHFEAPRGSWPEGRYVLVLRAVGVQLPFTLPADDPKAGAKAARELQGVGTP